MLEAPNKVLHPEAHKLDITTDIQSLTTFRRSSGDFMKHLKKSKRPIVLTVNGKAAAVVQDAEAHALYLVPDACCFTSSQLCHPERSVLQRSRGTRFCSSVNSTRTGPALRIPPPERTYRTGPSNCSREYHPSLKSAHVGLFASISTFFSRLHRFNCFSRAIASSTSLQLSNHTSRSQLYVAENPSCSFRRLCSKTRFSRPLVTPT